MAETGKKEEKSQKKLGLAALIAIAVGGMVGSGIFSVLGISVERVGNAAPIAIFLAGVVALIAAYPYVKLALHYKDEGSMYSFFKKTFPEARFAVALVGWLVVFTYVSTLALYAFTFASYLCSVLPIEHPGVLRRVIAAAIVTVFALINLVSVEAIGKIENAIVYPKLLILVIISIVLAVYGDSRNITPVFEKEVGFNDVLVVAALTFVAYEGFELVINATCEMKRVNQNLPRSIYISIAIVMLIYLAMSWGALMAIPNAEILHNKDYALAAGAGKYIGTWGLAAIIAGALLATSSAIGGTIFGAARLIAVMADDGFMPGWLGARRKQMIPFNAIILLSVCGVVMLLPGRLATIVSFGSITFLLVSLLMACTNYKIRAKTGATAWLSALAVLCLGGGCILMIYYQFMEDVIQLLLIVGIFLVLTGLAWFYARKEKEKPDL